MKKLLFLALVAANGCSSKGEIKPASVSDESLAITGPYVCQNLAIYILEDPRSKDDLNLITLEEGLKGGVVVITEKEQAQVHELLIENRSDKALFLQAGDLLKGGQQDRAIGADFVVPPKSGKIGLPSFCVEQGRWSSGASGSAEGVQMFALTLEPIRSTDQLRAIRLHKNQGELWKLVADEKRSIATASALPSKTDSLNEERERADIREKVKKFEDAFEPLLEHRPHACGWVVALNGTIETADLYSSPALFRKLYLRLVRSAAVEAIASPPKESKGAPTADEARRFLVKARDGTEKVETLRPDLVILTCENPQTVRFTCRWRSDGLHVEVLRK